jgi:hypothetical protein
MASRHESVLLEAFACLEFVAFGSRRVDVVLPEVSQLEADLTYPEHPVNILDQKDRVTWRKTIKFFKVQWSNHTEEEATWESEEFLCSRHPGFALL